VETDRVAYFQMQDVLTEAKALEVVKTTMTMQIIYSKYTHTICTDQQHLVIYLNYSWKTRIAIKTARKLTQS